jgi:capping protein alpha
MKRDKLRSIFLKSAPPGEFIEVFTDVRRLMNNDTLLNSIAPTSFKEYNTDQYLVAQTDDLKGIVSNLGEKGANQYLEPNTRRLFTFDHLKQQVTGATPFDDFDRDVEPWRAAVQNQIHQYIDDFYQEAGCFAVYGSKNGGQFVVTLVITSAIFNPDNFWNGRWRSTWTVSFNPQQQANISGNIKLNVHYYEEGNVQLVSNANKETSVPAPNPETFATNVVNAIIKLEGDFHNAIDSHYDTMSQTTFKALRRPLPVFKSLMNWNALSTYEVSSFGH